MDAKPKTGGSQLLKVEFERLHATHPEVFRSRPGELSIRIAVGSALAGLLIYSVLRLDIAPDKVLKGLGALAHFLTLMMPPDAGSWSKLYVYLHALGETVAIALLGTALAAGLAFPLAFLASRNVLSFWPLRFLTRRSSDVVRGIDQLIWALIWVGVVGLGPMAGVLALATSDLGTFVKIFSEAIETADRKPADGVTSTGANSLEVLRYAIIPQVLPVMTGQTLYLFESNVRSSTIIGIVGAGGIGLHLSEQIRTLEWQHVSLLIIMILVAVAITDAISGRLRAAISGRSSETVTQ